MKRRGVYFTGPSQVEIREELLADPAPGQVQVKTMLSAISPGTEALIYQAQFPDEISLDQNLPALAGGFHYPFQYGYCLVGEVVALGPGVEQVWKGRRIFAFHPHESQFNAALDELIPLPAGITPESAVFLPNMETAVNFVMDGAPLLGERVIVFGQGIVGLLTAALLTQFPLETLITLDRYPLRRQASLEIGAAQSFDPGDPDILPAMKTHLRDGADLAYELSGSPAALDQAIALTGFSGRVVIGSWYGKKKALLDLGGAFHRSRVKLISSQVSTLAPELTGRWNKARRFDLAWEMIRQMNPHRFITQRFKMESAADAYRLLVESPGSLIQIVLDY